MQTANFICSYAISPWRSSSKLVILSKDKKTDSSLRTASFVVVGTACLLQFAFQLCLQDKLLAPLALGHVVSPESPTTAIPFSSATQLLWITEALTSFAVAGNWFLVSLYMFLWSMVFSSRANFRSLFLLNGYAMFPLILFSLIGCVSLLCIPDTSMLWGDLPLSQIQLQSDTYAAYMQGLPIVSALRSLSYIAEVCVAALIAVNTCRSQEVTLPFSVFGAALYSLLFFVLGKAFH